MTATGRYASEAICAQYALTDEESLLLYLWCPDAATGHECGDGHSPSQIADVLADMRRRALARGEG